MKRTAKKALSILLSILLALSVSGGLALPASASTFDGGSIDLSLLKTGDVICGDATFSGAYDIVLAGGGYSYQGVVKTADSTLGKATVSVWSLADGVFTLGGSAFYYPVADGAVTDAWIVTSASAGSVTLTGTVRVTFTHVSAVAATCVNDGNIEYWLGSDGLYYDAEDGNVITDIVDPATGVHTYTGASFDWTDVEAPTYSAACSVCGAPVSGTAALDKDAHAATLDADGYTVYTASVTLNSVDFNDTLTVYDTGSSLALKKAAFDAYKTEKKTAAGAMAQDGDSAACAQLITDAQAAIDALPYDETVDLAGNKAAVDAIVDQLALDLAAQRAADQLTADKAAFDAYKTEKKTAADAMAQDGDSAKCAQLITDAKAEIDALVYDETKDLAGNKARVDAIIDQLASDLAAARAVAAPDTQNSGAIVLSGLKVGDIIYGSVSFDPDGFDLVLLGGRYGASATEPKTVSSTLDKSTVSLWTLVDGVFTLDGTPFYYPFDATGALGNAWVVTDVSATQVTLAGTTIIIYTHVDAVAPDCGNAGNIEYWLGSDGLYYDAEGGNVITDIVDPATGAHTYTSASFDWTDVEAPTYSAACSVCGQVATGNADLDKDVHAATLDADGYTVYTASVTLNSVYFDDAITVYDTGSSLALRKAAFDDYKSEKKTAAGAMAQDGDSAACAQLITDAQAAIDALPYDETKTLDENKAAADAIVDQLALDLAAQRAADQLAADKAAFEAYKTEQKGVADGMAQDGDSAASKQLIEDAKAAIGALPYDESKDLAGNKAAVDDIIDQLAIDLAAQRAADAATAKDAADKAAFEAYKTEKKGAADAMAQDGDSAECKKLISDAKADIGALVYDDTKDLDGNKARVDAIIDQLAADLAAARASAAPDTQNSGAIVLSKLKVGDIIYGNVSFDPDGFDLVLLGRRYGVNTTEPKTVSSTLDKSTVAQWTLVDSVFTLSGTPFYYPFDETAVLGNAWIVTDVSATQVTLAGTTIIIYTHVDAVAADCGNDGNIEYWAGSDGLYYDAEGGNVITDIVDPATGAHNYPSVSFGWTDPDNPTYSATCSVCGQTVSGTAGVSKVEHAATLDADGYTVYTASVTLLGVPYSDDYTVTDTGSSLALRKDAFDAYKTEKKTAADGMAQEGDSAACAQLISDAKDAIDALPYDETKTLDENKAAVDAIIDQLATDLAAQRAADQLAADKAAFEAYKTEQKGVADGMAQEGDSAECAQLISDAKDDITALTYDESKTLDENKAAVDAIIDQLAADLAAQRAIDNHDADKAAFEAYKTEQKGVADGMINEGDSEECKKLVEFAKAAIDVLEYDESKTLDENKAAVDEIINDLARLLAAQREADKKDDSGEETPTPSSSGDGRICPICGKIHVNGVIDCLIGLVHEFMHLFLIASKHLIGLFA